MEPSQGSRVPPSVRPLDNPEHPVFLVLEYRLYNDTPPVPIPLGLCVGVDATRALVQRHVEDAEAAEDWAVMYHAVQMVAPEQFPLRVLDV